MNNGKKIRAKLFPSILALACTIIVTGQSAGNIARWVVQKNSTLQVAGKSNVNSFTCSINQYSEQDTISFFEDANKAIKLTGVLEMDVISFDCNSSMINKDLQKTLKADTYPKLRIRFISLKSMPALNGKNEQLQGVLEVELAGVVKRFEILYLITRAANNFIQLSGNRNFTFSDFKLSPPQKFAGLIKIKDDFNVNFQLMLKAL